MSKASAFIALLLFVPAFNISVVMSSIVTGYISHILADAAIAIVGWQLLFAWAKFND